MRKHLRRVALITLAGANVILAAKARHLRQEQEQDNAWREKFDTDRYEGCYNHQVL